LLTGIGTSDIGIRLEKLILANALAFQIIFTNSKSVK